MNRQLIFRHRVVAHSASLVPWLIGLGVVALSVAAAAQTTQRTQTTRTAPATVSALPTMAELRGLHDAGEYRTCLRQIARVMPLGMPVKGYDRYDLLMLRGGCLLHLDDPETAEIAYREAAESPVPDQAHEARATALLIERSGNMTYLPKIDNPGGDGINIASRAHRMKAFKALLKDELAADQPQIERAETADNLVPIQALLPKLQDLYAVERTATGEDVQVRPVLKAIGQRARELIGRELTLENERITAIEKRANQQLYAPFGAAYWWWGGTSRRGLYSTDRHELRNLIAYLQRVDNAAKQGQQIAQSFDGNAQAWDPLIYRASRVLERARSVLEAE